MSDGRKRLSGAAYKKQAEEKRRRESHVLKFTAKIDSYLSYFSKGNENNDLVATPVTPPHQVVKELLESLLQDIIDVGVKPDEICALDAENATKDSIKERVASSINTPISMLNSVSTDPAEWVINEQTRDFLVMNGIEQNIGADFSKSRREYATTSRMLSKSLFVRKLQNGETADRKWLVYSESQGTVFCAPCRLFGGKSSFAKEGFSDWKNGSQRMTEHEKCDDHMACIVAFKRRGNVHGRVETHLLVQMEEEIAYWRNVLQRVVAVIKSLSSRGLAFRGHDAQFGSVHNGNFLMAIELIAAFDPFLQQHVKEKGNKGSGKTSYLSQATYEELIQLMSNKMVKEIVQQVKKAKYYSIILDSTPDISHVDQLALVIRYVTEEGTPIERFLRFFQNTGHKAAELSQTVQQALEEYGLDIQNCRGQSYDNASNMSGAYSGLQARIKEVNPLADYVPCAAHSLNLVGICSTECCPHAVSYFEFLQQLYNFFSTSTHRWENLTAHLQANSTTLKSLSNTRWSSRSDACVSLAKNWFEVKKTLESIQEDFNEKPSTRSEATALLKPLRHLETAYMSVLWSFILKRFNACNAKLQSVKIDISIVLNIYASLIQLLQDTRDMFHTFEQEALQLSAEKMYQFDIRRRRKRKQHFDEIPEPAENDALMTGRQNFRVNTFHVIIDKLLSELNKRRAAYEKISLRYQVSIITVELLC
jgi:hypothetical protein